MFHGATVNSDSDPALTSEPSSRADLTPTLSLTLPLSLTPPQEASPAPAPAAPDLGVTHQAIISGLQTCLPPGLWEFMSPEFLTTFWSLTLYDIVVPTKQ